MKREYRTPYSPIGNTLEESNVLVTRPKTARYDMYTLIKTGIDHRDLLPPLPHVFKKSSIAKQGKTGAELTAQQLELRYPLTSPL